MSHPIGPIYARQDYAGFIRRTLALVIDVFLGWALIMILTWGWY